MHNNKISLFFSRIDQLEINSCLRMNGYCRKLPLKRFFVRVSRLGDGLAWYLLMLLLPVLFGLHGLQVSASMALTGLVCTIIYKTLKGSLVRTRPFLNSPDILCGTAPLDRYSFPSGHTMHAVCFCTMLVYFFPLLGMLVIPFTILVALSRVILGLHYPTDVIVGALLGAGLAYLGIVLHPALQSMLG
ncbi:MAG: phosphatase PAP2 family protein [unclassified Hahellaceae]|nr:phosphatase PAP2 family protein [Hahellaceae bacterium]|tara:strand:+ start:79192 stop:79755 length:564 start_codon:yes stop_codon:yes gene_type:complete